MLGENDPIVVTGLGTVLAPGAGREALASALESGEPHLVEVDASAGYHRPGTSRRAALADSVDLSPWLSPRAARRMSRPSKYAVAAARMAIEDSTFPVGEIPGTNAAVVLGTAFGTARFAEALIHDILTQGPESASPFHFSESVANAPAAQIAISLGAHGANVAVTQREASALIAVALAAREVRRGRSELALAGATDEINPLVHAVLGRFGALAPPNADGDERAHPLSPERDGFLAAEGSTVLVLEPESKARERGAPVLARLRLAVRGFDPTAPAHDWGQGAAGLATALRPHRELLDSVDLVVSGASGSCRGDALELSVLERVFDGSPPPIETPKAVVGEYAGGALAAAVLALTRASAPRRVLTSALAAGGAAAWLVLERP